MQSPVFPCWGPDLCHVELCVQEALSQEGLEPIVNRQTFRDIIGLERRAASVPPGDSWFGRQQRRSHVEREKGRRPS